MNFRIQETSLYRSIDDDDGFRGASQTPPQIMTIPRDLTLAQQPAYMYILAGLLLSEQMLAKLSLALLFLFCCCSGWFHDNACRIMCRLIKSVVKSQLIFLFFDCYVYWSYFRFNITLWCLFIQSNKVTQIFLNIILQVILHIFEQFSVMFRGLQRLKLRH